MLTLAGIGFCSNTANIWSVVGYFVLIIKIVIPLLLIVLGTIDLGRAVISSDEKAIKSSTNILIKRYPNHKFYSIAENEKGYSKGNLKVYSNKYFFKTLKKFQLEKYHNILLMTIRTMEDAKLLIKLLVE